MGIESAVTRRTLLVAGAATVGAATLAACSGGSDGGAASDSASEAPPTKAPGGSASSTPAATSSAAGSSAASSGAAGDSLAALSELKVGEPRTVDLPNAKKGLLTRTSQTAVACFSTVCTHEGCTVKPDGSKLACPCHGSVFDATTGEPTSGPAPSALATIDVKVVGDQVVAG